MAIIKRPETDILYSQFKYKGKRYLRSTGTTNLREAEQWERRFRTALEDEAKDPSERPALVPTLAKLRDMDIERALGEGKTLSYVKHGIGQHWKWLIGFFKDAEAVTADSLRMYVKARAAKVRGQTIRKELTTLKRGLKLGQAARHKVEVPTVWPKVRDAEPDSKQEGRLWPRETVVGLLEELDGEARDVALLAMLTGLRRAELYRVTPDWVKLTPGAPIPAVLRLPGHGTKGRRKREVGLVGPALEVVMRTPFKEEHKGAFRFASQRVLGRGAERLVHLRDLRHTFATIAADRTGDELGVAMVLGHATGLMTLRYQTADVGRLAKIALAVHGWLCEEAGKGTSQRDISESPAK